MDKCLFNNLVDTLLIESEAQRGTRVCLRKHLPSRHPPINRAIVQGWQEHFDREANFSPYQELKRQNWETPFDYKSKSFLALPGSFYFGGNHSFTLRKTRVSAYQKLIGGHIV